MDNAHEQHGDGTALDPGRCRQARLSRDPRFDGQFFLAVRTTGIYCRPICPARPPAEKNVTYYRLASQAAAEGYRPCLRCRPESAPHSPAWEGSSTTVQRALRLIREGALNDGSLGQLAARLGIGERYLRKLFERELGVSPQAVAHNQRLLFARKLLAETALPLTDVAFAAGFGSVRRFNSAMREQFNQPPSALRRRERRWDAGAPVSLRLYYRPPYDWDGVLDFFARHAVEGIEDVSDSGYRRRFSVGDQTGSVTVSHLPERHALELTLELPDHGQLMGVVANIRRMFDVDANPASIGSALQSDPLLAPLAGSNAGVRSPGHWSLFEASIRAIVGQQVSTAAARGVLGRLARDCAGAGPVLFPSATALAALDADRFPMPGRRRETLQALCRDHAGREDALDVDTLVAYRGVGPWTVDLVAMRGAGDPDRFPVTDLGLVKAWEALAQPDNPLKDTQADWRPWRSYAANLLWRSLSQ